MKYRKLLPTVVVLVSLAGLLPAQAKDPYRVLNGFLEAARTGAPYSGAPLEGKVVAFANALGVLPFCALVESGIEKQLALAGCDLNRGWISMDNQYNPEVALQNADTILSRQPDMPWPA